MHPESLALGFKSATLYAIRLVLESADPQRLQTALQQRMQQAGTLFDNEPVIIDASRVEEPIQWPALLAALRTYQMPPIGVVAQGINLELARAAGLTPIDLSTTPTRPEPLLTQDPSITNAGPGLAMSSASQGLDTSSFGTAPSACALRITKPLRSGQRVYARHTDLVVIGMVSQGAEVIADGNVHVYGPLRGKAMAGAHGDTSACIFTTQLDAELLAIAGVYRVMEDKLERALHHQAAWVHLEQDTLYIEALKT